MTFTLKFEQADGTPTEPPSFETSVLSWSPGDTIPLGRTGRSRWSASEITTLDQARVLVVEDLS
jgi:hypothetical protein